LLPVLQAGYRALLSNNQYWYLDHVDVRVCVCACVCVCVCV
jgi:hypothetical protein